MAGGCGEGWGQSNCQEKGDRALADIEHGDSVGIGAQPEERRLAEAEDAAVTPDQRQADRQDRHDHVDREFENGIEFGQAWRQDQEGDTDDADQSEADKIEGAGVHRPLRKKRPVMPWGSRRIRTMAVASSATSPNTGVVANVAIWLMVPNRADAETVPLRMAAPPPITVMKDLAT